MAHTRIRGMGRPLVAVKTRSRTSRACTHARETLDRSRNRTPSREGCVGVGPYNAEDRVGTAPQREQARDQLSETAELRHFSHCLVLVLCRRARYENSSVFRFYTILPKIAASVGQSSDTNRYRRPHDAADGVGCYWRDEVFRDSIMRCCCQATLTFLYAERHLRAGRPSCHPG